MLNINAMEKLHAYMAKTGTRQSQLADQLGISRGYASKILHGKAQPGRKLIGRISEVTGGLVPPEAWFTKDSDKAA